jgi:hypothetical protein
MDQPEDRPGNRHDAAGAVPNYPPEHLHPDYQGFRPPGFSGIAFRQRMEALREKKLKTIHALTLAMSIMAGLIVMSLGGQIVQMAISMLIMPISMLNPGSGWSGSGSVNVSDWLFALAPIAGWLLTLLLGVATAFLIHPVMRRWLDSRFQACYVQAASFIHHTDILRVVAEENFTLEIIEAVRELPSLRWISPGQPKNLEQQLEFSACYWQAILELSYGPGRLSNASLISGSWTYLNSQVSPYFCCGCCCMSGSLGIIVVPFMVITFNHHLQRVARICCIIDYLIEDRFAAVASSGSFQQTGR